MQRKTILALIALGCVAAPCFAGTLYVPIVATEVDGIPFETRISVTNTSGADAQYTPFFIPLNTDGTERDGAEPGSVLILGNRTAPTAWAPGGLGMLEIETDDALIFHARLVADQGNTEAVGTEIPVLSADNLVSANQRAHLQAWQRSDTLLTDFGLINLSKREMSCLADVIRPGGGSVVRDFPVTLQPLSIAHVPDVLARVNETSSNEIRASVVCDQPFFPYAVTFDRETGESRFIGPSTSGASGLVLSDVPGCTPGAVCFEEPGVFHVPAPGNPVLSKVMMTPFGQYRSIHVRLTVTNGGWARNQTGSHNIFWLVRVENRDLVGFVNVRGPNRNDVFARHGFGQMHRDKPRLEAGFAMEIGVPYLFDYLYDTEQRLVQLTITDPAGRVTQARGAPDIPIINFEPGHNWLMEFGLHGLVPNEPATFGWIYEDLLVEFVP